VALLRTLGEENVGVYTSSSKMSFESIQEIVDVHAISSSNGRCVTCETKGPCGPRSDALEELARWHQLPRRRVGATRPELVNARRLLPPSRNAGAWR
jgi:hypothetical protein